MMKIKNDNTTASGLIQIESAFRDAFMVISRSVDRKLCTLNKLSLF